MIPIKPQSYVYVQNRRGRPLMPTRRMGAVRRWLKSGVARVVQRDPFTIRFKRQVKTTTQPLTMGIDPGYGNFGVSIRDEQKELFSATVMLLVGESERLSERKMYRQNRRYHKRYRPYRPLKNVMKDGDLPPSVKHRLEVHLYFCKKLVGKILPNIERIRLEVNAFDTQLLKDPEIFGEGYQKGPQLGFLNVKEYVLFRDGHKCQWPQCKNKSKNPVLRVHHIGYWKEDRSNRPDNLITICTSCHNSAKHEEIGGFRGWQPLIKGISETLKQATNMGILTKGLKEKLYAEATYGYITKAERHSLKLEKSELNDAFVIGLGNKQTRALPFVFTQIRRNNRSLETFRDAVYLDKRTNEKAKGKELFNGRTCRNKNLNTENLKVHRGKKITQGNRSIRNQRYEHQTGDLVLVKGGLYESRGVHSKGRSLRLKEHKDIGVNKAKILLHRKGIVVNLLETKKLRTGKG
ncbi:RNA-guided endonuclease IscB [Xanthovirga aplysinae]|uniref:RNA-guided endonuclease IscB n=1 Tax=Xanthovirga aplysinae TaxID=2529853 RepID=UPI0012BBBD05|nr:RNA-guided endonuclease IscB [Xanthovirga aplysinae]MTI29618.1 paclitaxel/taxanoid biosynthesis susceptibility protein TS1 [Xanthovirga aplysinae]